MWDGWQCLAVFATHSCGLDNPGDSLLWVTLSQPTIVALVGVVVGAIVVFGVVARLIDLIRRQF